MTPVTVTLEMKGGGNTVDKLKTAQEIQTKINAALPYNVTVKAVDSDPHAWDITFPNQGDFRQIDVSNTTVTGASATIATRREGVFATTREITVGTTHAKTAAAIDSALKLLVGNAFNQVKGTVKFVVKANPEDPGKFAVIVKAKTDIAEFQITQADGTPFGDSSIKSVTLVNGTSGLTSLTIEKRYDLPELFENSYVADLWSSYWGEVRYDKIVITNVDANTTVIGGSDENLFKIVGDASFEGTLIGQKAFRPLTSFANFGALSSILQLDIPNLSTINTLDFSDGPFSTPTITNLTQMLTKGAVDVFTITESQAGKEVQRLVIPDADAGAFTLSGLKADGVTPFKTAPIGLHIVTVATLDLSGSTSTHQYTLSVQKDPLNKVDQIVTVGASDEDTLLSLNTALDALGTAEIVGTHKFLITLTAGTPQGLRVTPIPSAPAAVVRLALKKGDQDLVAQRMKAAIDDVLGGTTVKVNKVEGAAGAWDIAFQLAGVDFATMIVAEDPDQPLRNLIENTDLSVTRLGTPQPMKQTLDLSQGGVPASIKLMLETGTGAGTGGTTEAVPNTEAAIKTALQSLVKIYSLGDKLGPVTVTETSAESKIYNITFGRGNAKITVLDSSEVLVAAAGVNVTQYAQSGEQNQKLKLDGATSGVFTVGYNVERAGEAALAGEVSIDLGALGGTLQDALTVALNAKLGAGAVTVTGDATSGLDISFDANVVEGLVKPLTLTSQSLAKDADVGAAGVGPVKVVRNSIVHEIQQLTLDASATGSFVLTLKHPTTNLTVSTGSIALGANKEETATNIRTAIDNELGANSVEVTALDDLNWQIEFLLPGDILDFKVLTQPTGGTFSEVEVVGGQDRTFSVQEFRLNGADSGSFTISYDGKQTESIAVTSDPAATGLIDAKKVADDIDAKLTGVVGTVNVRAIRHVYEQTLTLTSGSLANSFTGGMVLTIVDPRTHLAVDTGSITINSDKNTTASNIEAAIEALFGSGSVKVTASSVDNVNWKIDFSLPYDVQPVTVKTQPTAGGEFSAHGAGNLSLWLLWGIFRRLRSVSRLTSSI